MHTWNQGCSYFMKPRYRWFASCSTFIIIRGTWSRYLSRISTHGKEIMFNKIIWKCWITRSLISMHSYFLRHESYSKTHRDGRRYKENTRLYCYASIQKKHPRNSRWFTTLSRSSEECDTAVHALSSTLSNDDGDVILLLDT